MSQEWYYSVDGDRQGPVTAQELKKLVESGTLKPADLVWKDGMADWVAAKTIKGLFGTGLSSSGTPAASAPVKTEEKPKPSSAFASKEDDEEDDLPKKRRREIAKVVDDDEEEDDRPRRKSRYDDDEEEDDDRPRKKKRKRGGGIPDDVSGKKVTAGLLAILLGGWGIHKFYLGMSGAGILQIVITFITCGLGAFIPLIEGILYLTKPDDEFYETYIIGKKAWF